MGSIFGHQGRSSPRPVKDDDHDPLRTHHRNRQRLGLCASGRPADGDQLRQPLLGGALDRPDQKTST